MIFPPLVQSMKTHSKPCYVPRATVLRRQKLFDRRASRYRLNPRMADDLDAYLAPFQ
jgi:hypothetical protein